MKTCPKCNSSYADETLTYCLTDGTALAEMEDSEQETKIGKKKDSVKEENISKTDKAASAENATELNTSNGIKIAIVVIIGLIVAAGGFWFYLSKTGSGLGSVFGGADSPTAAYKRLFAAVKSKDTEAIKKQLTKKTIDFAGFAAQRNNAPIEKVFENGFTATTFSDTLPTMRDERVNDNMGAVEVWNSKDSKWEDLPFIMEDGAWKLAVGDLFANIFKSPGKGRDLIEKEAANAIDPNHGLVPGLPPNSNVNTTANKPPPIIKPKPMANAK